MANYFNYRTKMANPGPGDCNWFDEWYKNHRIIDAILNNLLDTNFVKSGCAVTAGAGLNVDITAGVVNVNDTEFTVVGGSKPVTGASTDPEEVNFIWVDSLGAIQSTIEEPEEMAVLLAVVDTDTTSVLRIADLRQSELGLKESAVDAKLVDYPRKNLLINGLLRINQRDTHSAAASNGAYLSDRFSIAYTQGAYTMSNYHATPINGHAAGLTVNTAVTSLGTSDLIIPIVYKFEGYDTLQLGGKTVTLSFNILATKTGTYCITFRSGDNTTGGITKNFTVTNSDAWESKEVTITIPTALITDTSNGRSLIMYIGAVCGTDYQSSGDEVYTTGEVIASPDAVNWADSTSNLFLVGNLQLEIGDAATELASVFYEQDLALCKRYYQIVNVMTSGQGSAVTDFRWVNLPVEMRSAPTPNIEAFSDGYNVTSINFQTAQFTTYGIQLYPSPDPSSGTDFRYKAKISLNSEL